MLRRVNHILKTLSIKDLRQLNREFGFPDTGNQAILIQRLLTGPKIIEDNFIFSEAKNLVSRQVGGANLEKLKSKYLSNLEQKYQENVKNKTETVKQLTADELFGLFVAADPSDNHKYTEWLLSGYLHNGIKRLEDLQARALPGLQNYEKLLRKKILKHVNPEQYWTDERNILNYLGLSGGPFKKRQYPGLEDLLEKYQSELEKIHGAQAQRLEARSEAKVVFENDLVRVYQPLTEAAACYYGQKTRWCTAGTQNNMFDAYSYDGPIYIIIPKEPTYKDEKYQFQHETGQYMDEKDKAVDPFELFQKYNMTSELDKVLISIDDPNDPDLIKYPNNPIKIDLSDRELIYVPNWIFKFTRRGSIQILDLSENDIRVIPPKIGQLTNLQRLDLTTNHIQIIPPEIGQLTNLRHIDFENNKIQIIPPEIGQLTNLKTLSIGANWIEIIPSSISLLTNLKYLYLGDNKIEIIPPEIGQLTNLVKLHLVYNKLTSLPAELGQLTNLKTLYIFRNRLTSLPPEIGQLTNLEKLSVFHNRLTSLPPEIGQLTNLIELDISDNPNLELDSELIAKLESQNTKIITT